MDTGYGPEHEHNQEDYSFLQEVIKDEKKNARRWGRLVALVLIFALAAFSVFGIMKSWLRTVPQKDGVPYVGIVGTIVTSEVSETEGIPEGLYVTEVLMDSPAMEAGIQSGDIITKVGQEKIVTLEEYEEIISRQEIGETITLTGQRYGAKDYVVIKFEVTVGMAVENLK